MREGSPIFHVELDAVHLLAEIIDVHVHLRNYATHASYDRSEYQHADQRVYHLEHILGRGRGIRLQSCGLLSDLKEGLRIFLRNMTEKAYTTE